jgi:hypothetical protein
MYFLFLIKGIPIFTIFEGRCLVRLIRNDKTEMCFIGIFITGSVLTMQLMELKHLGC